MSEVTKPVEEPVAAPVVETPAATEPVVETKAAEEPATETPAAEPAAATEETPAPAAEESKAKEPEPVEEGVLTYKGPGLIKTIFSSKKFFWFGTEPIEEKALASYIRGEKEPNHNVAWAAHTGKGLLLFSKKATEKATPAGVINLADISDIVTEDSDAFHFTLAGHKHSFVAANTAERDGWVLSLKAKSAEATEIAPAVKEHETYKSKLEALKPAAPVAAAATPKKSTEVKKEDKAEAKEDKKEDTKRNRSASRKRTSIFGTGIFGGNKKEEAAEAKADAPAAEAEPAAAAEAAPVEATPAEAEPAAPVTEAAAPAPVETPAAETKPAATKRNSIFGTLSSKFAPKKEAKTEAEAPAVPAKDTEPVADAAPVIPAVEATEPLTEVAAAAPAEVTTNGEETKAAETPVAAKEKRKTSIPWLSKKEKATSDEETDKPKSPFSNLRNTFKGKPKAKTPTTEAPAATEAPVVAEAEAEAPAAAPEAKAEEPVVAEPVAAAPVSAPVVSATA